MIRFISLPHSVTCNRDKSIMLQRNKYEILCLLGLDHFIKILPLIEKNTVKSNVLPLNLKLFRTKLDIKSVIRDYLLRNYVVNVYSFETCKLSNYNIAMPEDPMFPDNKLPRSDARHVNR